MEKLCSVEGCGRRAHAKGMCDKHYRAWRYLNVPGVREARLESSGRYLAERWRHDPAFREAKALYEASPARLERRRSADKDRYAERSNHRQRRLAANRTSRRERLADPDRRPEADAANQKKLRTRRSRRRGIELADPAAVQRLSANPCSACGTCGPSEVDHIIPLSWADDCPSVAEVLTQPWAYQPLCGPCNRAKGHSRLECYVPTGDIGD